MSVEPRAHVAVGQKYVPTMEPWQMETWTKTCGPFPGGSILTHTPVSRAQSGDDRWCATRLRPGASWSAGGSGPMPAPAQLAGAASSFSSRRPGARRRKPQPGGFRLACYRTTSPSSALLPFFWGRVPLLKWTTEKRYSNLSTGGPTGDDVPTYLQLVQVCSLGKNQVSSLPAWSRLRLTCGAAGGTCACACSCVHACVCTCMCVGVSAGGWVFGCVPSVRSLCGFAHFIQESCFSVQSIEQIAHIVLHSHRSRIPLPQRSSWLI